MIFYVTYNKKTNSFYSVKKELRLDNLLASFSTSKLSDLVQTWANIDVLHLQSKHSHF